MSEDEAGKKREWGESCFSFDFVSHHPTLFLTGKKLIFTKPSLLARDARLASNLPVLILTHDFFFILSSPPVLLSGESERAAG